MNFPPSKNMLTSIVSLESVDLKILVIEIVNINSNGNKYFDHIVCILPHIKV